MGTMLDFTLTDQNGQPWTLSAHLKTGAVVLVFYRGDW
jgi:peroxiredoxin